MDLVVLCPSEQFVQCLGSPAFSTGCRTRVSPAIKLGRFSGDQSGFGLWVQMILYTQGLHEELLPLHVILIKYHWQNEIVSTYTTFNS